MVAANDKGEREFYIVETAVEYDNLTAAVSAKNKSESSSKTQQTISTDDLGWYQRVWERVTIDADGYEELEALDSYVLILVAALVTGVLWCLTGTLGVLGANGQSFKLFAMVNIVATE